MNKRIAVITMARNDEFFLSRWIKYYGDQVGTENLYIYLDGTDQETPENADKAHITKLPHTDMSRSAGDKYRIGLMSDLAKNQIYYNVLTQRATGEINKLRSAIQDA